MIKETDIKTIITVHCVDKTQRIINVQGYWTISMASSLAKDLEGDNYRYTTISF